MVRLNMPTTLLSALAAVAPLTSAWSIVFYSEPGCNGAPSFNNIDYAGTGTSPCVPVGDPMPGNSCIWYTDNVANSGPCTAPMNPIGSFLFTPTGDCWIGWSASCEHNVNAEYPWSMGNTCFNASDLQELPDANSGPVTFYCEDV